MFTKNLLMKYNESIPNKFKWQVIKIDNLDHLTDQFLAVVVQMRDKFFRPAEQLTRPYFSHAQFQALSMLYRNGIMPMSELAGGMKISKQQLTPIISKLISNGMVVRQRDEQDRRIVRIEITATGKKAIEDLRVKMKRIYMDKLGSLPEPDLDELENILLRIQKILQGIT